MVWSLALRSDDAKQDPVVYGTKFGVVCITVCTSVCVLDLQARRCDNALTTFDTTPFLYSRQLS